MVFLFRDKSVVNILFLLLLSMVVHAHLFISPTIVLNESNNGLITTVIIKQIKSVNPTILFVLYHLIIVLQAIRLNLFLDEARMFPQQGYTVSMAYILLTGLTPQWSMMSSALISNFLLLWLIIKTLKLYNHQAPKTQLFDIGLIMGLSILAYQPIFIMIPVLFFSLGIMRAFRLQEWFVLLMGILLPFYFLVSWLYITDQLAEIQAYLPSFQLNTRLFPINNYLLLAGTAAFIFVFVCGFFSWQRFNGRLVIQMRKNWSVLLICLLIIVVAPFVCQGAGISSFISLAIPVAAFAGAVFSYPKRLIFPNLIFWILVVIIVWNNFTLTA